VAGCEASATRKRIQTEELPLPMTGTLNKQNPVPMMPCKEEANCAVHVELGCDCQIAPLREIVVPTSASANI